MFLHSKNRRKRLLRQVLPAYLMIFLIVLVDFPFKLLHQHNLALYSPSNRVELIENHIKSEHFVTAMNNGHHSQIDNAAVECWWCRLMATHVFSAQANFETSFNSSIPKAQDAFDFVKTSIQLHYPYYFNKGPPVC